MGAAKPRTLAQRLTLIILGSIATAVITLTAALLLFGAMTSRDTLRKRLMILTDVIGQNSNAALSFGDRAAGNEALLALRADTEIVAACLYDATGDPFANFRRDGASSECPAKPPKSAFSRHSNEYMVRPVIWRNERVGEVLLISDLSEFQRIRKRFLPVSAGLLVLAMTLGGFVGSVLQRQISDPIDRLVIAMRTVTTRQKYDIRVNQETSAETNSLAIGFNAMLAEIQRRDSELRQNRIDLENELAARQRMNLELAKSKDKAESANRSKSEFLANMSHEIRTPMNGIIGMTELALETNLTAEQREYLSMVKSSANSLLSIINDILDFSKIEAGRVELEQLEFNLHELIAETLRIFSVSARQKGLELSCDIRRSVVENVVGDPHRIRQILMNVIGNAIKFTQGGEVEVIVERLESEPRMLSLVVRDTGIGVPVDKRDSIFDAFSQADSSQTRRYGGTGLGLAITSRLVKLMNGKIWVDGREEGSEFHVLLPLPAGMTLPPASAKSRADASALAVEGEEAATYGVADRVSNPQRRKRKLHLLAAEDNRVNQRLLVRLLEKEGHWVTLVEDGYGAVTESGIRKFSAILMDIQMPNMDGLEATRRIRARENTTGEHVPIIALTAHAMKGDRERCLAAGMDMYIAKPLHKQDLLDALSGVGCPLETDEA